MRFDAFLTYPFSGQDGDEFFMPFGPFQDEFQLDRLEIAVAMAAASAGTVQLRLAFSEHRNIPNVSAFNALDDILGPAFGSSNAQRISIVPRDFGYDTIAVQLSRPIVSPKNYLICSVAVFDENVRGLLNLVGRTRVEGHS